MLPIRSILHATDFSERSGHALHLACALARDYDARLTVLHVADTPAMLFGEGVILADDPEATLEHARRRLQSLAIPEPTIAVVRRFEEGHPATRILEVAEALHVDLIVLGTHGRTGLSRLLMGSVAGKVVRKAPCPVLTVTAPFALEANRTSALEQVSEPAMPRR